ncbi:hypothetical protein A3F66_03500 [candidate division TM6 bacterium RIFCSPHIGHO2_12_FULL_32_22]|nr:MAG: hypothetical protein A3F66_03500 [candidate division TM6 bacterium RIFCSPHIGHO2_12_FULL_32_22]
MEKQLKSIFLALILVMGSVNLLDARGGGGGGRGGGGGGRGGGHSGGVSHSGGGRASHGGGDHRGGRGGRDGRGRDGRGRDGRGRDGRGRDGRGRDGRGRDGRGRDGRGRDGRGRGGRWNRGGWGRGWGWWGLGAGLGLGWGLWGPNWGWWLPAVSYAGVDTGDTFIDNSQTFYSDSDYQDYQDGSNEPTVYNDNGNFYIINPQTNQQYSITVQTTNGYTNTQSPQLTIYQNSQTGEYYVVGPDGNRMGVNVQSVQTQSDQLPTEFDQVIKYEAPVLEELLDQSDGWVF